MLIECSTMVDRAWPATLARKSDVMFWKEQEAILLANPWVAQDAAFAVIA